MIIRVLGDDINTEKIYKVTDIEYHTFKILFVNGKEMIIHHPIPNSFDGDISKYCNAKADADATQQLLWIQEQKDKALAELMTLRDAIIAYWSNNQSTIPKLEFV